MPTLEEKIFRLNKFISMTEPYKPGVYRTELWERLRRPEHKSNIVEFACGSNPYLRIIRGIESKERFSVERRNVLEPLYKNLMTALAKQPHRTPALFLAVVYGMPEFAEDLLQHGADVHHKVRNLLGNREGILSFTLRKTRQAKVVSPPSIELFTKIFEVLFRHGANANETFLDESVIPPHYQVDLDLAAVATPTVREACSSVFPASIFKLFLENGASPNNAGSLYGNCLLNYCQGEKLQLLIEKGANPNTPDTYGNTPIMALFDDEDELNLDSLKFYLKLKEVDLSHRNNAGETVADLANKFEDKTGFNLIQTEIGRRAQVATQAPRYFLRQRPDTGVKGAVEQLPQNRKRSAEHII